MPIARQVDLIDKHKLVKTALDKASETFVVDMTALKAPVSIITINIM